MGGFKVARLLFNEATRGAITGMAAPSKGALAVEFQ